MNELLDDVSSNDPVIARLRSALDEVNADSHGLVPVSELRPRVSAGRWMAAAAAVVLIAGTVTAIAINRGNAPEVSSTPTEVATTTPTIEPDLIRSVAPWYVLSSPDLVPGRVDTLPNVLGENPVGGETSMVWARNGDPSDALLVLRAGPGSPDLAPADTSLADYQMIGDSAVAISSYGLSTTEQTQLASQVVPGSGLPWVLPVEPWVFVGFSDAASGPGREQTYSGTAGGTVTVGVGPLVNQFLTLATNGSIEPVTVAGANGWKATDDSGVYVVWPAADSGFWGSISISAELAERADGLIAGVTQVTEEVANQPTVETVLAPPDTDAPGSGQVKNGGDPLPLFDATAGTDAAVGMPAPAVVGHDFDGNEVTINPAEGAHLIVFVAHWCPHCNAELPLLVQAAADGTVPTWLPITLVSTAESTTAANYPPQPWLAEQGWTGQVIQDGNEGDGAAGTIAQAYGASGWPYYVVIGGDGNVVARSAGELSMKDLQSLIATIPAPEVVGRLKVPSLGLDVAVLDNAARAISTARAGPVLVTDAVPSNLPIGGQPGLGASVIYGNRTTFGAPFLDIDRLVAGDRFTWTDVAGTSTFEVVTTNTCDVLDDCAAMDGMLALVAYTPQYTAKQTLWVWARRVA